MELTPELSKELKQVELEMLRRTVIADKRGFK